MASADSAGGRVKYDAFISYNHDADLEHARAIEDALQRFAKPWYRRRSMTVFRDENSLSASPDLFDDVTDALDESRYYVLLMSQGSKRSEWVGREIAHWLGTKSAARRRIVLVLTQPDGQVVWHDVAPGSDLADADVVNPALRHVFPSPPLHVDLSAVDPATWADRGGAHRRFRRTYNREVAMIAARVMESDLDTVQGEDERQHRRTLRVAWGAATLLLVLAVAATLGFVSARRNAREARRQTRTAQAGELAARSNSLASTDVPLSLATAVAAYRHSPSSLARDALTAASTVAVTGVFGPGPRDPASATTTMATSPDGRLVATTDGTTRIRVWDTGTGEQVSELVDPEADRLERFVFTGDGRRIVATYMLPPPTVNGKFADALPPGAPRSVVWDARTGTEASRWQPADTEFAVFGSLAAEPGGPLVAVSDGFRVVLWDTETGDHSTTLSPDAPSVDGLAFSPDGRRLLITTGNRIEATSVSVTLAGGTAQVWDVATRTRLTSFPVGENVRSAAISSDGRWVVTGDDAARVELWDATDLGAGAPAWTWTDESPVTHLALSPSGDLVVSGDANGRLHVRAVATHEEVASWSEGTAVSGVAFTADGSTLATGDDRGHGVLRDARRLVTRATAPGTVDGLVFPDAGTVVVATSVAKGDGSNRDVVLRWDAGVGARETLLDETAVDKVALSGDGSRTATINATVVDGQLRGVVTVADARTGATWGPWVMSDDLHALALTADGSRLVVAGLRDGRGYLETRDVTTLPVGAAPPGDSGVETLATDLEQPIVRIATSRSGTIATVDASGTTTVWRDGRKPWRALDRPLRTSVDAVTLSADGGTLATIESFTPTTADGRVGTTRHTVRVRDVDGHGAPVTVTCARGAVPSAVALGPDGRTIVIGDQDHRVSLCDVATGRLLETWTLDEAVTSLAFDPGGDQVAAGDKTGHLARWDVSAHVDPPGATARSICHALRAYRPANAAWSDAVADASFADVCG